MSTLRLQVAPRIGPAYPLGSRIAAAVFLGGAQLLAALARPLARPVGRSAPRTASPAEEARAVRELALQYRDTDPRFAADLLAAADRHEQLHVAG